MFYPSTFPDELHEGYYGRLISFNALPEKDQKLLSIVRKCFPSGTFPSGPATQIEMLAYSANMTLPDFVRKHTLLPYRRAIASHKPELAHGDANDLKMIKCAAGRLARPGAYFCVACVEKDRIDIGISYWRRAHQLPGTYVCREHGKTLSYTEKVKAFLRPPSTYIEGRHLINEQWAMESHAHPAVSNFLSISIALSSSELPFQLKKIRSTLVEKAKEKGIHSYSQSATEVLSDRIVATFPAEWLETIFPGITAKPIGKKVNQIDGVLYLSTCSSAVAAYFLAICVLFDSTEEALTALTSANVAQPTSPEKEIAESTASPEIDLRAEYVRTRGNHLRIARENELELHTVINGLRDNGLPNLTTKGKNKESLLEAAANFFIYGHTLVQSAERANVRIEDLERVVRYAGADLYAILKKIVRIASPTKADAPLGINQLPHLIGRATR